MPQDVQKTNNLSISNVDQWKPPTDPIDMGSWRPPTKPISAAPVQPPARDFNLFSALMDAPKFVTDAADKLAENITTPRENSFYDPKFTGFAAGALQGASRLLSPFNIATTALGAGEGAALKSLAGGNEAIEPLLQNLMKARQIGSLGVTGGGLKHLFSPDSSWQQRLAAIPEIAGGLVGTIGGKFVRQAPTEMPKMLGPAPEGTPRFYGGPAGVAEGNLNIRDTEAPYSIQRPEGGTVTPSDLGERFQVSPTIAATYGIKPGVQLATPDRTPNLDPNRFPIPGAEKPGGKGKTAEEIQYELARKKFNMGQDMPTERTREELDKNSPHGSIRKTADAIIEKHGLDEAFKRAMMMVERNKPGTTGHDYWRHILSDIEESAGNEPQMARSEKGGIKLSSNVTRSALEVTTGYDRALQAIMVREMTQNAIDAVRHLGELGKIVINTGKTPQGDKFIEVADNGKGMNRSQLEKEFSTLFETGKADESGTTGGKGVGKASYMLGGQHFEITTVHTQGNKKIAIQSYGKPEDFEIHWDVKEKEVPIDTPTGTIVKTILKSGQGFYDVDKMVNDLVNHTRDVGAQIQVKGQQFKFDDEFNATPEGKTFKIANLKDDKTIGNTTTPLGHAVTVTVPKNAELKDREYIKVQYLNNGMYQFSDNYFPLGKETPHMPDNVIVNVSPNVKEGHPDYPFPTARESLKDSERTFINNYIIEKLAKPQQQARKTKLVELYNSMESLAPYGNRPSVMYDPGARLTPEENSKIQDSQAIYDITGILDEAIDKMIDDVGKKDWANRLERTGLILDDGMYGVHVPNPETNKSAILINPFLHMIEDANPKEAAFGMTITALHEVAHIGTESGGSVIPIQQSNDPRTGKFFQSFIEQLKNHGGLNPGHGIGFLHRLGDVYAAYGPEQTFTTADKFHEAITDEHGNYSPEVQELLHIYKESRGRAATTEDFLSGTGDKSKSTSRGKGGNDSNDKSNAERTPNKQLPITDANKSQRVTPDDVIGRLTEAIRDALPQRAAQENMYSMERAKRIAAAMKVLNKEDNQTIEGHNKAKSKLAGELPKVDYEGTKLSENDVNSLISGIVNSPHLLPYEKIRAIDGLRKLLSDGPVPQRNELDLLRQAYGKSFDGIVEMHGGLGAVMPKLAVVSDLLNLPKAIMASYDLSAPLRQGLPLIHKKEWWGAILPMIQSLKDPKYYEGLQQSIKDDPDYLLAKEAKLGLTDIGDVINKEEAFPTKLASQIPGLAMSERAYVGFLNKLRFDSFKALIQDAKKLGIHPKDSMFEIAKFVNTFTGRGSLDFSGSRFAKAIGQGRANFANFDKVANELNAVFFSPRLIASRLTILNPRYYLKASPFIRKEALKALMAIAGAGMTVNTIMSMFGGKTNTSLSDTKGPGLIPGTNGIPGLPINADFGKSRFGNTRDDPWAGLQQYAVFAGRMLSGESESSVTGKRSILGKGFNANTRYNVLDDFVGNKLAPIPSLARVALKQKDYEGNPIQFAPDIAGAKQSFAQGDILDGLTKGLSGELINRYKPMLLNDLLELYKDDPNAFPSGIKPLLAVHAAFGGSLQTYKKSRGTTNNQFRLRLGR